MEELKKKFQFYATPSILVKEICELTFNPIPTRTVKILEPQAGQGAIIDGIYDWFASEAPDVPEPEFTAIEFMKQNYDFLKTRHNEAEVLHMDFLKYDEYINYFDYVIGNPPFSKGQDIEHFYKMYEVCKPGGKVTSVMSTTWAANTGKKYKEFRNWLGMEDSESWIEKMHKKALSKGQCDVEFVRISKHGNSEKVNIMAYPAGTFKESGTNMITCVITIEKNDASGF